MPAEISSLCTGGVGHPYRHLLVFGLLTCVWNLNKESQFMEIRMGDCVSCVDAFEIAGDGVYPEALERLPFFGSVKPLYNACAWRHLWFYSMT